MSAVARSTREQRRKEPRDGAPPRARHAEIGLPAIVADALAEPGEPLDAATRGEMQRRLGHDFADVRVHADALGAAAADALDSEAFTSGADIVFARGRYRPDDGEGRRLLAHELVHSLQQGRDAPAVALQISSPVVATSDPLEAEAAAVAERVTAGETVPPGAVSVAAPAARGRIARQAREAIARVPLEVPNSPDAIREVADDVARLLGFDPDDGFGRARRRLAALAPMTREAVAGEVRERVPAPAAARLAAILTELRPAGAEPPAGVEEPADRDADAPRDERDRAGGAGEGEKPAGERTPLDGDPAAGAATAQPQSADVPELEPQAEAPVALPALEVQSPTDVSASEPPPGARERDPAGEPADGAPAPAGGEAEEDGADEGAADLQPAEETEAEALDAHDEAGADDVEDAGEGAFAPTAEAPGPAGEAPAVTTPDAPAVADTESASELGGESPAEPGGDPFAPAQEADPPESADAEPEGDEEIVDEMPPAQPVAAEEAPAGEADALEPEGAEETEPGAEADAEPEDSADPDPAAEDEPAAEAQAAGDSAEGGGVPIEEPAEPDAPDVSGADPVEAMTVVGNLAPAQAAAALTGVDAAATRSVGAQRTALAEQPPELERPTGAPTASALEAESEAAVEPLEAPDRLAPEPEAPAAPASRPAPLPPAPVAATAQAHAPQVQGGQQGELSADDRQALRASIGALPVRDPGLELPTGPAPALALEGAADPQRAHAERAKVEEAARTALADGRRQLLQPAGEDHLVPRVAPERLRAAIAPAPAAPPAAPATATPAAGVVPGADQAASIIAGEQRGAELRAASADAAADMRGKRAEHAATAGEERRRSQERVTELVRESAAAQTTRRRDARTEVHDQRRRWSTAEHAHSEQSLTRADQRLQTGAEQVARVKTDADEKARTHLETGERDAEHARREGERKAAAERKRGEQETSGPIGWLASKATAFFDEIKHAITEAFEAARAAVRDAIEGAKRLAVEAIDFASAVVVETIRKAGDALIAIGDTMLAGFPGLRDRFRGAVRTAVARAQAAVEQLAADLKSAVQKALDLLGAALDAALGLLEKGLLLAVASVRASVNGALRFANGVLKGFAAFAVLVRHVAANPKRWVRNLAASAKDGVRNHLWKAFKVAIKRWFWEKVEEVLGLGLTIWNLLKKGGISLSRIGTMAWEGIKAAIPRALIQILIEKLISLLVPAAAAVMLIIEGLQAAWGTVQRVLEAFARFFTFLKAVRTGHAGPQFANAVAAAAIAVIDFVANWLLKRLRKPAGKIAKKLKAMAKKLGKKLAKLGKGLFKKRRKKPKLKGKPKKKKLTPDKRAKAQRRVDAATDFIGRQLARKRSRAFVLALMLYVRGRWRVRTRFTDRAERPALRIEANPLRTLVMIEDYNGKPGDIEKYRKRAKEYQGFLRAGHHVHHIFARTHRDWWEAAEIDWNAPEHMLELPEALHLGALHASYKLVDPPKAWKASSSLYNWLHDAWNKVWTAWLVPQMTAFMGRLGLPPLSGLLGGLSKARRRRAAALMRTGANWVVGVFSQRLLLPLWHFKLRSKQWRAANARFADPMAKFDAALGQKVKKSVKAARIIRWKAPRGALIRAKDLAKVLARYFKGS